MCGITGIWQRDHRPIERATIQRMTDSLMHRGPDAGALWVSGDLGLGHRRLSVIDLSAHAAQPIWLPDRSLAMVYNGEIHNYRDLARQLRAAGAILRAENDTEVLLWSYRLWGESCFERLNGMWAAAFWEPAKRTLVLSRDRFGIKPLLYSVLGSRVAFASEAKAILTAFPEERRPQRTVGREFLEIRLPDQDAGEAPSSRTSNPYRRATSFESGRRAKRCTGIGISDPAPRRRARTHPKHSWTCCVMP
jgi:asparagine synthase (glutamine-hydrolysing)